MTRIPMLPKTGPTDDLWTMMLLCTCLCLVGLIVLLSVARVHRRPPRREHDRPRDRTYK